MIPRALTLFIALALMPISVLRAQRTDNPHGDGIGSCATCHAPESWRPVRISKDFKHAERVFPLEGAHLRTSCTACHKSLVFSKVTNTCASCHNDVHQKELGTDCARCHTTRSFVDQGQMKRMHELTRFPLRGAHSAARCDACHAPAISGRPQYTGRSTACFSCHEADYRRATSPDHAASQFPRDCASCHGNSSWLNARFDHSATRFALAGAHKSVSCSGCHADKVFHGKSMECVACHKADYDRSANPPHAGFPTTCASCHTVEGWKGATFDHNTTRFALTGSHRSVSCAGCHADNVYQGKPTTCISCHRKDYDAVTVPPHASLGYSTVCGDCHTSMTTWKGAAFDHQAFAFPLTGAHLSVSCSGCHADNVFRGKPTACASCHQSRYDATTNPPHSASGFSTACETCHTTASWTTGAFNHSATSFPLEGTHATISCMSCHGDGVYAGKSTACISCHKTQYDAAVPSHAGYSTTCRDCHTSMVTWSGANFDHQTTSFPLTGAHLAVSCSGCHYDNVYNGKSTACVSCHQSKYNATTNPQHVPAGFSTSCESCHSTSSWLTATYDHSVTRFPLTGAHRNVSCNGCHADGVFRGKTMLCSGCHLAQYTATTNPNHAAASFPTTCESCHTTTSWLGATFDHDSRYFPIYSGSHKDRWRTCADCHTSSTNYAVFSCFQCHLKPQMDDKHKAISGYSYDSQKCYACHPTGSH